MMQKNLQKVIWRKTFFLNLFFVCILKVNDESKDPHPDPDPLVRGMDPRIRIHTKMSWIRNTGLQGHEAGEAGGEGAEPAVPPLVGGVQGGGGGPGQQGPGEALRSMPPLFR